MANITIRVKLLLIIINLIGIFCVSIFLIFSTAGCKKDAKEKVPTYYKIKHVEINNQIDSELSKRGSELFLFKCSACHKINEKYIGPALKGVTDRRTPEWIVNMIIDPIGMVQNDPDAKALLAEYGAPMANQSLTEEEAKALFEYFRSIDKK